MVQRGHPQCACGAEDQELAIHQVQPAGGDEQRGDHDRDHNERRDGDWGFGGAAVERARDGEADERDAEVARPDQPVERLGRGIEVEAGRRPVGDQRRQLPVRVEPAQRLEQHARGVQVREGEAGIDEDFHQETRSSVMPLRVRS